MIGKILEFKGIIYSLLTLTSVTFVGYEVATSTGIIKPTTEPTQVASVVETRFPSPEVTPSPKIQGSSVISNSKPQEVLGQATAQQPSVAAPTIPQAQQVPQQNTGNTPVSVNVIQTNENVNQNMNQNTNINQVEQTNISAPPEPSLTPLPTATPTPTTTPVPQTKEITFAENRPQPFNSSWVDVSGYMSMAISVSITGSIVQYAAHYTNNAADATDFTGFVEQTRINCGGTTCPTTTLPILGKYYRISTGTANGNVTAKAILYK